MIDATGMPQTAAVIGGTSEIALAIVGALAERRLENVVLAGRDGAALEKAAGELRSAGVKQVATVSFDAGDPAAADDLAAKVRERLGGVDLCLLAIGDLGTADLAELDGGRVASMMAANAAGPCAVAAAFAREMKTQGYGRIVGLSSVAAVRVRRANFAYGAGKAAFDSFLTGLSYALEGTSVAVTIVRPGFVRTKMTKGLPAAPLAIGPSDVAAAVVQGLESSRHVVWAPSVLRYAFAVMRLLPAAIWKRLPA